LGQFQNQSSLAWMTNMLNSLTQVQPLTGIARRENLFRPIRSDIDTRQRSMYKWLSVTFVPALIIIWAIMRQMLRSRRQKWLSDGPRDQGS